MCADNGANYSQGVMEAAQKVQESLDSSSESVGDSDQDSSQRRLRVKDLFYAMDKDGNGKLDVGEFRGNHSELVLHGISVDWFVSMSASAGCLHHQGNDRRHVCKRLAALMRPCKARQ